MPIDPHTLLDAVDTAVMCVDRDGVIVYVNAASATMSGRRADELVGMRLDALADPASNPGLFDGLAATFTDGQRRVRRNDSVDFRRAYENTYALIGDLAVIQSTDVTAEVEERQARQVAESIRSVVWDHMAEIVLAVDVVGRTIITSPDTRSRWPMDRLEGIVAAGQLGDFVDNPTRWADPWPDAGAAFDGRVERSIAEVYGSGNPQHHRTRIPGLGEEASEFEFRLVPWHVGDRRRGVIVLAHDLTRHLAAEVRGALAEQAVERVLENLPVQVWDLDLGRGLITPLYGRSMIPGLETDQPVPVPALVRALPPAASGQFSAALDRLSSTQSTTFTVQEVAGDRSVQMSLSRVPTPGASTVAHAVLVMSDITDDLVDAEEESRLEHARQVMRFAQGVAHDFGNVAQTIGGYAEILQRDPEPAIVRQAATRLASAAARGVSVSRRIARIAAVQQVVNAPLDLVDVVSFAESRLQQVAGPGVTVAVVAPTVPLVVAERAHVVSALENLVENAAHAMQGAGRITVGLRPVALRGRDFVELFVADSGPGLDPALVDRVFEPFVSGTSGRGSGLGLYLIQEYLHSLGGMALVESSTSGATFRLLFPVA